MSAFEQLEKPLEDLLVEQAPPLSNNAKRALVRYLPWISLILGLSSAYAVYVLWHWAHLVNNFIDYTNSLNATYGGPLVATDRLTFGIWFGLALLAAEAALYLAAFPATRDRKKSGWDLLFYAMILNFVYGIFIVFTAYGGLGNLIWAGLGSLVGMYVLFQIRSQYERRAKPIKKPRTENKAKKA